MIRKASIMQVYPDRYEEYKRRHDELWPEMVGIYGTVDGDQS